MHSKSLQIIVLGGLQVLSGFLFIITATKQLTNKSDLDGLLYFIIISGYVSIFSQLSWENIGIYYLKASRIDRARLLSSHLIFTVISGFMVFGTILAVDMLLAEVSLVIPVYAILLSLIALCKRVCLLEDNFMGNYALDIVAYLSQTFSIAVFANTVSPELLITIGLIPIAVIAITLLVVRKIGCCCFHLDISEVKQMFKGSFVLKMSGMLYSLKDAIIATSFKYFAPGSYTIYTYASKISNAAFSISSMHIHQRFYNEFLSQNNELNRSTIKKSIVWRFVKLASGFVFIDVIGITLFKYVDEVLNIKIFDAEFLFVSLVLLVLNIIVGYEQFFARIVAARNHIGTIFKVNFVYIITLGISAACAIFAKNPWILFIGLIVTQLISLWSYRKSSEL